MEIKRIFVSEETGEGLYAMHYYINGEDEFSRLFDLWTDAEYVYNYCRSNSEYLKDIFFEGQNSGDIENKIIEEAEALAFRIEEFTEHGFEKSGRFLQTLFKPLHNDEYIIPIHQATKMRLEWKRKFPKPLLRLYAVRLGPNTFIITGGAIKLTRLMKDHPATLRELEKINIAKQFLKANDILTEDDITYYYE